MLNNDSVHVPIPCLKARGFQLSVICTKMGSTRRSDKSWVPFNMPANLRTSIRFTIA